MDIKQFGQKKSGMAIIIGIAIVVVVNIVSIVRMVYDDNGGSYRIKFEMELDDDDAKEPHIDCHKHLPPVAE